MKYSCIQFLEEAAEKYPDSIAVDDTEVAYTYTELRDKSRGWASVMSSITKQNKSPIAVFLPKSSECIVAFMSILYTNNFYVSLDTQLPLERLKAILNNLKPLLVMTLRQEAIVLEKAGVSKEKILCIDEMKVDVQCNQLNFNSALITDPVYLAYTSGSTGIPKGVIVSHETVMEYVSWSKKCYKFSHKDHIGSQTPFYYVGSDKDVWPCIAVGAKMTIIPQKLFSFPKKLIEFLIDREITSISWVPSVLCLIADTDSLDEDSIKNLALNRVIFTGEPMPTPQINYWREKLPKVDYYQIYGASEARACMWYKLERKLANDEPIPLGYPRENTEVFLLDDDDTLITSHGKSGELCVRGNALAIGYWNDNEKTRKVFMQNPLHNNYIEIIYRTGDLATINEYGEIIYSGRKDAQIKHLGHRIELSEIEVAASSIKEINRACVIYDKNRKEIALFYISNETLSIKYIREKLRDFLPEYMLPTCCFCCENFPKNSNGKIDRIKLNTYLEAEK